LDCLGVGLRDLLRIQVMIAVDKSGVE